MSTKAINSSTGFFSKLRVFFVWAGWLAIVIPSIVYSINSSYLNLADYKLPLERWTYIYLNFGSFIVGLIAAFIIFWRKSKNWLAVIFSLMLVTWTSTDNGYDFWIATRIGGDEWNVLIAYFLSLPYTWYLFIFTLYVLLTFPDGNWSPKWTRWLFTIAFIGVLMLPIYICGVLGSAIFTLIMAEIMQTTIQDATTTKYLEIFFAIIPEALLLVVLALGAVMQIYRLFTTKNLIERQQIKWISASLAGMTLFFILFRLLDRFTELQDNSITLLTIFLLNLFFTYGFIISVAISIFKYRLWDIDNLMNKTLVYSVLTTILAALGISGAILFELYAKQYLGESSPIIGLIIIFPLTLLFVPLRDGLQNFVDSRFKPEEIDFSGSIVEFAPEAQLMLTSNDILKILARQVKEQLSVTNVEIYLKHKTGKIFLSEPIPDAGVVLSMVLIEKERSILEKGDVLVPADTSQYSLYLPLTLKRASKPEFLGVLALGLRENGVGYSSNVLKSLKKFGGEAGKVLYIAKLRESTGKNILERLASLERGLVHLKTDLA